MSKKESNPKPPSNAKRPLPPPAPPIPSFQNIPLRSEIGKKLRDIFTPPTGSVFIETNYSTLELRILASLLMERDK